jgi:Rap1a immunity proteins
MRKILFVLGFLLLAGNAEAQLKSITGSELVKWCKANDNTNIALCSGYFMGFLEYNSMVQFTKAYEIHGGKNFIITKNCIPSNVRNWDVVEAFLDYMVTHPERNDYWAYHLIRQSIEEKWPCEKNN